MISSDKHEPKLSFSYSKNKQPRYAVRGQASNYVASTNRWTSSTAARALSKSALLNARISRADLGFAASAIRLKHRNKSIVNKTAIEPKNESFPTLPPPKRKGWNKSISNISKFQANTLKFPLSPSPKRTSLHRKLINTTARTIPSPPMKSLALDKKASKFRYSIRIQSYLMFQRQRGTLHPMKSRHLMRSRRIHQKFLYKNYSLPCHKFLKCKAYYSQRMKVYKGKNLKLVKLQPSAHIRLHCYENKSLKNCPIQENSEQSSVNLSKVKMANILQARNRNLLTRNKSLHCRTLNESCKKRQSQKKKLDPLQQEFCIFFNRFGKCTSGNDCRFLHDRTKVNICTKFLKGNCEDENCTLSHEVDSERMPVCMYFLEGGCGKLDCPYRHVKVNENAKICRDFQKGNCQLGTACMLKHIYVPRKKKESNEKNCKKSVENSLSGSFSSSSEKGNSGDSGECFSDVNFSCGGRESESEFDELSLLPAFAR